MDTQKFPRETQPGGLQPQHGSGMYMLMVNNNPAFSSVTTSAICGGVLALLVGATLVPVGLLPLIPASAATGVLLFACLASWAAAYLSNKSNFPMLAGGMLMSRALIGVAGVGLLGAPALGALSLARTTVMVTLLLSAVSGIICMNLWKMIMLRAGAPAGKLRLVTAHWWHLAFGGLIFAIVLSPFTIPAMFSSQAIFLVARLVPLTLSVAMALALIERSRAYASMRHVGERVAALGLAAQLALLVSMNPLSPAWGVALVLVFGQIFTIGQWLLALQMTKSTGAQAQASALTLQNDQLRATISQRQQTLQAVSANEAKAHEDLNAQREQWQREIHALAAQYENLHRDFEAVTARVAEDIGNQSSPDAFEMRFSSLATLMHDLTHPLSAIMGSAQLILLRSSPGRDPALTRQAQTLYSYSRRLTHTAKFVLDYDKAMEPLFQQFDLVALLRNLTKDEATIQPLRTITFKSEPPVDEVGMPLPATLDVTWERDRIEAVLFNLLDNAEKYSGRTSPIMVRAWLTPDAASVVITVSDRGAGMSEAARQRIFERRYRSNEHAGISGHGLGLWMVRTIVAQHHGVVDVRSAVGEGTMMRLTIPHVMPDNQDESESY